MRDYRDFKKELFQNKKIRAGYEAMEPEFRLAENLIRKRLQRGLTQKALAAKIKTKQSAISRLESGRANPSMSFLQKVAFALGGQLKISI